MAVRLITIHKRHSSRLLIPLLSQTATTPVINRHQVYQTTTRSIVTSATSTVSGMATCSSFGDIRRAPRTSDEEYKKTLTKEQYSIAREGGTERPFTGKYYNHHAKGIYTCICCSSPLFLSSSKFESGTGWPSFFDFIRPNVRENVERSYGMVRREVVCSNCDGHLGHVFDDGPRDKTGLRYCINSASLNFQPEGGHEEEKHAPIVHTDNACATKK